MGGRWEGRREGGRDKVTYSLSLLLDQWEIFILLQLYMYAISLAEHLVTYEVRV